eukprot:61563-Rhodomonas_salina.1
MKEEEEEKEGSDSVCVGQRCAITEGCWASLSLSSCPRCASLTPSSLPPSLSLPKLLAHSPSHHPSLSLAGSPSPSIALPLPPTSPALTERVSGTDRAAHQGREVSAA